MWWVLLPREDTKDECAFKLYFCVLPLSKYPFENLPYQNMLSVCWNGHLFRCNNYFSEYVAGCNALWNDCLIDYILLVDGQEISKSTYTITVLVI